MKQEVKQTINEEIIGYIDLEIKGQIYPLKFGINALILTNDIINQNLTSELLAKPATLRALIFSAMLCGAEYKKQEFSLDIMAVGDLIDYLTLDDREKVITAFYKSLPKRSKDDAKKK